MKSLSVSQFSKFASSLGNAQYEYEMSSQPGFDSYSPLRSRLVFKKVLVMLNPNSICLSGESGTLIFERVKKVTVCPEIFNKSIKINIICGNRADDQGDRQFFVRCKKFFENS